MNDTTHEGASKRKKAGCGSAFLHGPDFSIEKRLIDEGYRLIAGVDEAGRGALAGPLCVGIAIYDRSFIAATPGPIPGIDDSKKLTHARRVAALDAIGPRSILATSILVSHRIVDRLNVNGATYHAIGRLLETIAITPDIIILDGNFSFRFPVPVRSIPKGDARSISIASASIAAKVRRDLVMDRLGMLWPGYDFTKNKGYGTAGHIRAIRESGICPVHRVSYEPVKSLVAAGTAGEQE